MFDFEIDTDTFDTGDKAHLKAFEKMDPEHGLVVGYEYEVTTAKGVKTTAYAMLVAFRNEKKLGVRVIMAKTLDPKEDECVFPHFVDPTDEDDSGALDDREDFGTMPISFSRWTNGWAVGITAHTPVGTSLICLNPSSGGNGPPDVFVYYGEPDDGDTNCFLDLDGGTDYEDNEFVPSTAPVLRDSWTEQACRLFEGKRIKSVRYMTAAETYNLAWGKGALVFELDDGTLFYAANDDEGNAPGSLHGYDERGNAFVLPSIFPKET